MDTPRPTVFSEPLGPEFSEADIWEYRVKPLLVGASPNVISLLTYCVTEMMNNANDHSGAGTVNVSIKVSEETIDIQIADFGIGIFRNICNKLGLESERHAIFELTKGKVTTDPDRHTGEGIFFTSRMCDEFAILSGGLFLAHSQDEDWLLTSKPEETMTEGTFVKMEINRRTDRTTQEVFDRYLSGEEDDYAFRKTTVAVRLADEGNVLVSRSQAKRVMGRLERFTEVVLDFKDIAEIGPSFADEIFRVFRRSHPNVNITAAHTNESVSRMIAKAASQATEESR